MYITVKYVSNPDFFSVGVSRDKEKKKLSNIMEFGTENPPTTMPNQREEYIEEEPDIDRFDECRYNITNPASTCQTVKYIL